MNPSFNAQREIPTFEELSRQIHIERPPTWKNAKHGQQWLNTFRDYAFPKIGRMPVDSVDWPEVLMCLSPILTEKHETAKRLSQRIKTVLDVAKSKGFRSGENPVTAIREGKVLPTVKANVQHHDAMPWQEVPAFYAESQTRSAMAAKALQFTILTACRTSEVLEMKWPEVDVDAHLWTIPAERMKGGQVHLVPFTDEILAILEPLRALASDYVLEGQIRSCRN
ncbi:tyrosine-type recombinase/integrase [Ruegeria lacuscaerulensis]|uniref:tyrosine-type recombinase/integrase n=1 Tax=Ruegeria lacuscaerulensis TaxID=55218 RepID=UPI001EED5FA3|nr:tyrosine-type recombinase/integrase [Ruegeria lacuscaerulensis]